MKTKKNQKTAQTLKIIALLPVILLLLVEFSSCAARKKANSTYIETTPAPPPPPPPPVNSKSKVEPINEEEPFVVVEEMPVFPGGDEALLKFIAENTTYPKAAKDQKIQGKVIVRFCVTSKGSINRISIIQGVSPELDEESLRVVGLLPAFKPGKQGGKEVPVWYMVPITFALR